MINILGCKVENFPTVYLGLPLGAKRKKKKSIWQGVIDRCNGKLTPWKKQYLSMGGKLTLINSVLDGIPTYTMSLFRMPASIEKKLDSIRKQFLWDGNSDKKKIHLVKWQVVIEDKKKGGLGVRNLKLHNRSFLFKWLWRYTSGKFGREL